MEEFILPEDISVESEKGNEAKIVIQPCSPGYGTTLGNALRRVLLSSLEGNAITVVRIKKVDHEFASIKNVKEDVVDIILNLKKVRAKLFSDEPVKLELHWKGKGEVKASDFEKDSRVELVNPDAIIAAATSKDSELDMEIIIEKGRGYVPVEQQRGKDLEVGMIAIDAIFTPIVKIGYSIENIRVGQRTDYDKLTMDIETDGTVTPREALVKAAKMLINHFSIIAGEKIQEELTDSGEMMEEVDEQDETEEATEEIEEKKELGEVSAEETLVTDLKLSKRTVNALERGKVKKVKDILKKSDEKLLEIDGFGKTALNEVKKALKKLGIERE